MFSLERLFELVKSLTSNEKRLLQLHASIQSGAKNYMLLFELLDEMEDFDPLQFQQLYDEKGFTFNLSGTQNYLAEKILDMLCRAQEEDFIEARLNKLLLESKIMEQRGFYALAFDLLKKAKKLAKKHHVYYVLLEIAVREARIVSNVETKNLQSKFQTIFEELDEVLKQLQEENFYRRKSFWLLSFALKSRSTLKSTEKEHFKEVVETEILAQPPNNKNFYANLFYYKIITSFYYLSQNPQGRFKIGLQLIDYLEQHKQMLSIEFNEYLIAISNTIIAAVQAKNLEQVPVLLKKMDALSPKSFYDKAHLFQNTVNLKLFYFLNIRDFQAAQALAPEVEEKLPGYEHIIKQSRIINIYYNLTIAFFLDGDYDQAHHWLEKILLVKRTNETRKDILRFARILHLVLFYQLGQLNLLENLIRSVSRNKLVKEAMVAFDQLILKIFKKLIAYPPNSEEAKELRQDLYTKLIALPKKEQQVTGFEEIKIWLEELCGVKQIGNPPLN